MTYTVAQNDEDLVQILHLQAQNLEANITGEELAREGFVTVKHNLEILRDMNQVYHHVIAKDNDEVVAYALVMLRDFAEKIPVLTPMFKMIDALQYDSQALAESNYVVMGQICIAKNYRGQGVFNGLYNHMKSCLQHHFDYVITEVADRNRRSLKAHYNVGFKTVHEFESHNEHWHIVLWNWEN